MAAPTFAKTDFTAPEGFTTSSPAGTTTDTATFAVNSTTNVKTVLVGYILDEYNSSGITVSSLTLRLDTIHYSETVSPIFTFNTAFGTQAAGTGATTGLVNVIAAYDVSSYNLGTGPGGTTVRFTTDIVLSGASSADSAFYRIQSTGVCTDASKSAGTVNNLRYEGYCALPDASIVHLSLGEISSFGAFNADPTGTGATTILKNASGSDFSVCAVAMPTDSNGVMASSYDISSPTLRPSSEYFLTFRNTTGAGGGGVSSVISDEIIKRN
jgi:hypothetical protein